MRATCCWWWWWCGGWGGKRARECGRHSKIFFHSEPTAGRGPALSWPMRLRPGVCTLLQPEPHQSGGACVMWSGPLGREEASLVDPPEPPLKLAAGMGGQWCKAAPGNKQLWLRQANGERSAGPSSLRHRDGSNECHRTTLSLGPALCLIFRSQPKVGGTWLAEFRTSSYWCSVKQHKFGHWAV